MDAGGTSMEDIYKHSLVRQPGRYVYGRAVPFVCDENLVAGPGAKRDTLVVSRLSMRTGRF